MKLLAELLTALVIGFFDPLEQEIEKFLGSHRDHTLNASFGKKRDLFSKKNGGFAIGVGNNLDTQFCHNHVMVTAPSGVGKTSSILIPSIINIATFGTSEGASMVIGDPKREFETWEPFLRSCGYTIIIYDYSDPEKSACFNPFFRANTPGDMHGVIQRLVFKQGERNENDFWKQESIKTNHTYAWQFKQCTAEPYQNIANVYRLLEETMGDEATISNYFAHESEPNVWRSFKALIANSPRTKSSILSSAISDLSFIGLSPDLCDLTSTDTFDFSRLRSEKVCVFLRCPLQNQDQYQSIFGIFYSQLFDYLYQSIPSETDRKIFVMIDELANIPMPNLADVMSTARSYFAILGVIQSENQLYERYGTFNGKTILNNCTSVYMTGLEDECERIERMLGSYTYYEDREKKVQRTRSLMTAQEIRTMPCDHVLVIPNGGMKPILLKGVKPWYKVSKYQDYLRTAVDETQTPSVRHQTQYLPLEQYRVAEDASTNIDNDE